MKKKFDPTKKHIGLVRYADHYHATNEKSEQHLRELADMCKTTYDVFEKIPRSMKIMFARLAIERGFQVHYFEKGLGR